MRIAPPASFDWRAIDCVVLDMDGTLLDLHFDNQVWNELLPRRYAEAHRLAPATARAHIERTLHGRRGSLSWYCLDHWRSEFGLDVSALEAELEYLIGLRSGAREFLAGLVRRGVKRVLATNAHPRSLARKLALTGIASYFDDVVSAHELGAAKENDAFWPALAARTCFVPERTLFIDDNHNVLRAAARHGIRHLFGIARPDSHGATIDSVEFDCLESFAELCPDGLLHG